MKNRIIKIFFLLVITMLIGSCTIVLPEPTNSFKITYYLNGNQIILEPSEYKSGIEVVLPVPTTYLEEGEEFVGWYLTTNFAGEPITKIEATEKKDFILFGKTEKEIIEPVIPSLENILNIDNYSYRYEEKDETGTYVEEYKYDKGIIANTYEDYYGDTYTDYYYQVDGVYRFVYEYDGYWYYTEEGEENFELYTPYIIEVLPQELDANNFVYDSVNNCFVVKEEALQTEADNLMGTYEGEVFKSFNIYLKEDLLDKIIITSDYTDFEGTLEITYTITFTNIDSTNIVVPDAVHDLEDIDTTIDIVDVYEMNIGDTVTIEGKITGIYDNIFYLNDGTKGVMVYLGYGDTYKKLVEDNATIELTGKISEYNGVLEIVEIKSMMSISKEFDVDSAELSNLSEETLATHISDLVHIKSATISYLPQRYPTDASEDIKFYISLNDEEVCVFIHKYLEKSIKDETISILKSLEVGDLIDIKNLHVGKYNNYQFVVTTQTIIENSFTGEVKQTGISLSKDEVTAVAGALKEEILGQINVYATYNDGSQKQLSTSEYTLDDNFVEGEVGTYTLTFANNGFVTTLLVKVLSQDEALIIPDFKEAPLYEVLDQMGYDSEFNTTYGITKGLPSTGEPKVLVIPVEFTDALAPTNMVSDLEKAFFGTSTDTGWESLQSYYYKSSYGKLNIEGTVLEPFNTGYSSTHYDKLQEEYNEQLDAYLNYETDVYPDNVEWSIIKAALEYYDDQINYDEYDTDKDGYIDSIYLIYTVDYDNTNDETLWWAFTTEYFTEDVEYYDNVEADYYIFMSYHFLFDELCGNTMKYNTETIIHETGHLLGLDDYYDYDETSGPDGGIGGGDMMDYNVGDHNAFSKLLLGWVTPYVTTNNTVTIDLNSFEQTGDCIMICKNWNGSVFTEFYIIDFYTPTGLNEMGAGFNGLFSTSGIRIYHIDATLNNPEDCWSIYDITKYNNSYTDHRLISLVEADGRNDIDDNGYSENSDLFKTGDIYNNAKWYDNSSAKFTIKVNSVDSLKANITITF